MFRHLFRSIVDKPLLGRWNPMSCDKTNAIKVFWANMDHCGTCSMPVKKIKNTAVPTETNTPSAPHTPTPKQ